MPRRPLTRRMFKRQRIGHVAPGVGYRVGNSIRGLRAMKRFGRKWADRDIRKTRDGVIVVCHWSQPGKKDHLRAPGIPAGKRIEEMTWAEVSSLRSADGFRINRVETDIAELGRLRMGAYFEPKAPHSMTLNDWQYVKRLCVQFRVKARGYTLIANRAQIPIMRAAGIPAYRLRK